MANRKKEKTDYREIIIDSHIVDWDKLFLSKLDTGNYVDMLCLANVTSVMLYTCCHNGNCYYPTKVGHQHNNLVGKDIFGDIIRLCQKRGIDVVAYYSLIINRWVYDNYPEWRMISASGVPTSEKEGPSRHGVLCPNSGYRDFVVAQIDEICRNYEFKRMFFDMTWWPDICYCKYCEERFRKETGADLPRKINWEDRTWLAFQKKRGEWLKEFACLCTEAVKRVKPEAGVTHNDCSSLTGWQFGVPFDIMDACDYATGDFYGDATAHSVACKDFVNSTRNRPFEFFVSRFQPNLSNHTTTKPIELMEAQTFQAAAHFGRIIFIDATNPDGTLQKEVYRKIGSIYKKIQRYESFFGGDLMQDVGVYASRESMISLEDNGKEAGNYYFGTLNSNGVMNTCKTLIGSHVPFGIVTRGTLNELSRYKVVIFPNVIMMSPEEIGAITNYVRTGGSIYASKYTSLFDQSKGRGGDFKLSELFGVSYEGVTEENVTYISLSGKTVKADSSDLIIHGEQIKVRKSKGIILGTLTLPYTNPKDARRHVSIHSNPPGIRTTRPSIVLNEFGKGKICYVAGELEASEYDIHRRVFINLVRRLAGTKFFFEVQAPKCVELVAFKQPEKSRYIMNLVNFQPELPNIPVGGIKVRINLPKQEKIVGVKLLPGRKKLPWQKLSGNSVEIAIPCLETFLMFLLEYRCE